ncbi:MAG: hypothetical protein HOJ35_02410 [Bdellovibrionales bacterium]|nr:hypothetical protein [Bdellovibrionales bacterium]
MQSKIVIFVISFLIMGCSGYQITNSTNPLAGYGIESISVPVFINRTILPNISGIFTKEVILSLSKYDKLKVYSGEDSSSDSVLIGILESSNLRENVYESTSKRYISNGSDLKTSIGDREGFYLGRETKYKFNIRYILIKNPNFHDLEFVKSSLNHSASYHPKVIFHRVVPLSSQFSRILDGNLNVDDGGVVNFTSSHRLFQLSLEKLAKASAINFEGVILNAF